MTDQINPPEHDIDELNRDRLDTAEPATDGVPIDETTSDVDAFALATAPANLSETPPLPSRQTAALAGVLSAAVALGVGELLSGLSGGIPSLVLSVGDIVIDNTPGEIGRWAIDTLGTNNKPVLKTGIAIISLIVGAVAGIAASKNFRSGAGIFGIFGLLGGLAAANAQGATTGLAWIAAILAATAGIVTLRLLLKAAKPAPYEATPDEAAASRRGFLGAAAGAAAVGVTAPIVGTALRSRRDATASEADRETVSAAIDTGDSATLASFDDIDGIAPLISPNDNFYRIDSALSIPRIDVDSWSMKITGMVDEELEFTFDDLLAMDPVEEFVTLSCVSNRVGGDLVGNARWLGVPLKKLLDMAGVQPGATQIVGRSVDGWTGGFPTEYLDDPDRVALVAVAMNGEPLPTQHGFPVRLVVAGLYGYVSATKWLAEIELTTMEEFDGYWITRGWSKLGPIKTQSRIDVPSPNARLEAGNQPIAGVAWAPDRGVAKVEVLITDIVDGAEVQNENWIEAELTHDVTDNSWRQWMVPWSAPAGDHVIRVRATDGEGVTQTSVQTPVAPDGATGWHTIAVRVT